MLVLLLISSLPLTGPGDSITPLTAHNHFIDPATGTVGGIAGFAVVFYFTSFVLENTDLAGENFRTEAALGLSYALGMPVGAALGLDFVAKKKRYTSAFKISLKSAEIGVIIGITAVMVGGIISDDVKYWVAMAALPLPIISGVAGYDHWINLQQNKLQNGDAVLRDCKLSCRLWKFELQ